MKYIKTILFTLFFLLALIYALLQSDFTKNWLKGFLINSFKKANLELTIDKIEGKLPHRIDLIGVKIQGSGIDFYFDQINMKPIFWRLIKEEIAFKRIDAKAKSFDFTGSIILSEKKGVLDGKINNFDVYATFMAPSKALYFRAKNDTVNLKGKAEFNNQFEFVRSNITIGSDTILSKLPLSPQGKISSNLLITKEKSGYKGTLKWKIPTISLENKRLKNLKGSGDLYFENGHLTGEILAGSLAKSQMDLKFDENMDVLGNISLDVENLQSLHIPNIYGKIHAKANFEIKEEKQLIYLDATGSDLYFYNFYAKSTSLYSDLTKDSFLFDLEIEKGKWGNIEIENASFETSSKESPYPFTLFAEGNWNHPLELHINGNWQDHFQANIDQFNGTFYSHPFSIEKPVQLDVLKDKIFLSDFILNLDEAKVKLAFSKNSDHTQGYLLLEKLPLDLLSVNPLGVPVHGYLDFSAKIEEKNNHLEGDLKANFTSLNVETIQMVADGNFNGKMSKDLLLLSGNITANEKKLLDLDLSLPIHLTLWPFEYKLLTHKRAIGKIAIDGNVEDFLDFVDIGPHRFTGKCLANLEFTNTLSRPQVKGEIEIQNGTYENYYTGTLFNHIDAKILANKNTLLLTSLKASDTDQTGILTATGKLELTEANHFPFSIDAKFNDLKFLEIDLVSASSNGSLHIEGNSISAIAQGEIEVTNTELSIPDHIRRALPKLQITYKNQIHPVIEPERSYTPYPIALDIHVKTSEPISIQGKGLTSEWNGDFHLGNTFTSLAAKGKLELISGEFNFSSRSFKLKEGTVSLSGIENEMPEIDLIGSMETKGILISARLKGPLDNPQITLQSSPPLPLGSIVSYLLFGQDVSDIGGFEALQLANSLASLAGTGPDVMESTRKALGVDKLRIITDQTEEGGETVSIQVGKYVAKDVLVSITQGTDESSTNISVEVGLKNNFVFQVESDQRQEQGRFTLKWSLNY